MNAIEHVVITDTDGVFFKKDGKWFGVVSQVGADVHDFIHENNINSWRQDGVIVHEWVKPGPDARRITENEILAVDNRYIRNSASGLWNTYVYWSNGQYSQSCAGGEVYDGYSRD